MFPTTLLQAFGLLQYLAAVEHKENRNYVHRFDRMALVTMLATGIVVTLIVAVEYIFGVSFFRSLLPLVQGERDADLLTLTWIEGFVTLSAACVGHLIWPYLHTKVKKALIGATLLALIAVVVSIGVVNHVPKTKSIIAQQYAEKKIDPILARLNAKPGDMDGDGVLDVAPDNCVEHANPSQRDSDNDDIGDACDLSVPLFVTQSYFVWHMQIFASLIFYVSAMCGMFLLNLFSEAANRYFECRKREAAMAVHEETLKEYEKLDALVADVEALEVEGVADTAVLAIQQCALQSYLCGLMRYAGIPIDFDTFKTPISIQNDQNWDKDQVKKLQELLFVNASFANDRVAQCCESLAKIKIGRVF